MPIARFGFALLVSVSCARVAAAQNVDAVVKGVAKDQTGAVLPGATVTVTNVETGLVRSAATDRSGFYRLPPVPAGTYTVTAEVAGFRPQRRTRQILHVGTTVTIDFAFEDVAATEAVDVVADAPVLETTKNTLSRLVTREEIDTLPVADRNFNALASLAPGVTPTGIYGGVDVSGSRDFQNGYYVDGVSAEGLAFGNQRIAYAQDWIQEFQVLTGQYSAEFGRSSGGVLNAITRSGSSNATGRVYGFFRNGTWDATPAFADSKPPLDSKRLGATLGGRLLSDRLFFFGGFEWYDSDASAVVNSSFPEFNGNVPVTTDQKLYLFKLEHHSGDSSTFRARFNAERREATGLGVGGIVTEENGLSERYRADDWVAAWGRVFSATVFNELRAAFTETSSDTECNFARDNPPGTWFGRFYPGARLGCNSDGFGRIDSNELQLIDELSGTRGAHDWKAGVQASRARNDGDFRFLRDGIYFFDRDVPFSLSDPASYPFRLDLFQGPTEWGYSRWAGGVFVQDSWRATPKLTVNVGVRYDLDGSYRALNSLISTDRGLNRVRVDRDNVAPRVGIAWTPFRDSGRTVVRGGAGVYYDENHSNVATILLTLGLLTERAISINANSAASNPWWPDRARARRFLAEALAQNSIPDVASLPVLVGGTPDLERNLQVPYTMQASVGASRDFGRGWSASVDGVFVRGLDQYLIRNVNLDRDAALQGRPVLLNPNYAFINRYGNGGKFTYRALQIQAVFAPTPRSCVRLSYTLAKNESNTATALVGAAPGSAATNPYDYDEDFGPTSYDVRHNLVVNGVTALPLGIQISGILSARSALPWTVAVEDLDVDVWSDRPEPRNSRRGDGFFSLDLRLAKSFAIRGDWSAVPFVEVFNVTNETNSIGYINRRGVARFGEPTAAREKRRTQLGLRVEF